MLLAEKEQWQWLRLFGRLARWVGWLLIALWVMNLIMTGVLLAQPSDPSTLLAVCQALNCQPGDLLEYVEDDVDGTDFSD